MISNSRRAAVLMPAEHSIAREFARRQPKALSTPPLTDSKSLRDYTFPYVGAALAGACHGRTGVKA